MIVKRVKPDDDGDEVINADLTLEEAQLLVLVMGKFVEGSDTAKAIWEALQLEGIEPLQRQLSSINLEPILVLE